MRSFHFPRSWCLLLGLPLACGAAEDGLYEADPNGFNEELSESSPVTLKAGSAPNTFPGGGTSGAAEPLRVGLGPESSSECDPEPSAVAAEAPVQTVCFFSDDQPSVPAATIQQVVEVVGTSQWVHLRLTLNPEFVDNTYGGTAIGWGDASAGAAGPPAPRTPPAAKADAPPRPERPEAGAAATPPPKPPAGDVKPPREPRPPRGTEPPKADVPAPGAEPAPAAPGERPRRAGRGGHTFRDLVGSDHAEIELLDANGKIAVHFKLDYLSASEAAASGNASLGVSGGEGQLIVGDAAWILASSTSMDRNLNACGLGDFVDDSPATDETYTPNPGASDWDYRVSYEVWVSTAAFGDAGFGSALIENVHASPSKADGNTLNVLPAPCPIDPATPEATPEPVPAVLTTIR